jgi:hypothetical protein
VTACTPGPGGEPSSPFSDQRRVGASWNDRGLPCINYRAWTDYPNSQGFNGPAYLRPPMTLNMARRGRMVDGMVAKPEESPSVEVPSLTAERQQRSGALLLGFGESQRRLLLPSTMLGAVFRNLAYSESHAASARASPQAIVFLYSEFQTCAWADSVSLAAFLP